MKFYSLQEIPLQKGTHVLLRADLDVTINGKGIGEDFRIREALPTIKYLRKRGALVRIVAHLGRPKGRAVPNLSLAPIARRLSRLLGEKILLVPDPFSQNPADYDRNPILLFENIRFWSGEEANSREFAKSLSQWGGVYVNDAFAVSHRAHASLDALAHILPAYAGLHLAEEITMLSRVKETPRTPLILVLGGAKLETKLPVITAFLPRAKKILVGGAIGNTLLGRRGIKFFGTPPSLNGSVEVPPRVLRASSLELPKDGAGMVNRRRVEISSFADRRVFPYTLDIGPETVTRFLSFLKGAATIIWNGPLGLTEDARFRNGTKKVAAALAASEAFVLVGGGDTVAFLRQARLLHAFSHISTGGGAMLEFLGGRTLPGIAALQKPRRKHKS